MIFVAVEAWSPREVTVTSETEVEGVEAETLLTTEETMERSTR